MNRAIPQDMVNFLGFEETFSFLSKVIFIQPEQVLKTAGV